MLDQEVILRATHFKTKEHCHLKLEEGKTWLIGRDCPSEESSKWTIPFDPALSRRHFQATLRANRLWVDACENRHPILQAGEAKQSFSIAPGETFLTAHTIFELERNHLTSEMTYTVQFDELVDSSAGHAQRCLSALLDLQPVLSTWREPRDFFQELLPLLKSVAPDATSFQVYQGLEWSVPLSQLGQPIVASRTLLRSASNAGESQFHLWDSSDGQTLQPTMTSGVNWALACPIHTSSEQYILYVVGLQDIGSGSGLPGHQDRALIALIAKLVGQYFASCRTAQFQAEATAERRQRVLSESLRSLTSSLSESLSLENTGLRLLEALQQAVPFASSSLLMLEHSTFNPVVARPADPKLSYWSCIPLQQIQNLIHPTAPAVPLTQMAWRTLFPNSNESHQGMLFPLFSKGKLLAVIAISRLLPLLEAEIELLVLLSSQAPAALQNAQLYQQVEQMAMTDELTGLHNRRHFFQLAEKQWSLNSGQPKWAMLMDIDHFKNFNDDHGHEIGDAVLKHVADVCRSSLAQDSTWAFARYGGEEFVAISNSPLGEIAEQIRLGLEQTPLQLGGQQFWVRASFGVAEEPGDSSLQSLLKRADQALYTAKQEGRNRVCYLGRAEGK